MAERYGTAPIRARETPARQPPAGADRKQAGARAGEVDGSVATPAHPPPLRIDDDAVTRAATRVRLRRELDDARAGTARATLELNEAIAAGERSYRVLRRRLDDYDRRLQAARSRLRDRPAGPRPRVPQGPHC